MRNPDRPFDAPWQAELFALTVSACEAGAFGWPEWTQALGQALREAGAAADGNQGYYAAWLVAFERLMVAKGVATPDEVADVTAAWHATALATPHGVPIVLDR